MSHTTEPNRQVHTRIGMVNVPAAVFDRIKALEWVCEKALDELSAWDGKASADPATSIGYVVQILRTAVHPEAAKEATPK